jgi:hypothetical protein
VSTTSVVEESVELSNSKLLWEKIYAAQDRLHAAGYQFWSQPDLRKVYPEFLIQMYHTMRGGLSLMDFAVARSKALKDDPVAQVVAPYLIHHLDEEKDHMQWVLNDLAVLGVSADQVRASLPAPEVVSSLGYQYYWIGARHPVTLFGYLILLEGYSSTGEQLDEIMIRTGLPRESFSCLRGHAEDDPSHLADLNHTLDIMPLTPEQTKRIGMSMFHTLECMSSLFDRLSPASV